MAKKDFIPKGQEKQIIGLIAAVVIVFGLAIWRVLGFQGTGANPNQPSPVVSVGSQGGTAPNATVASSAPSAPTNPIVAPGTSPQATAANDDSDLVVPDMSGTWAIDPFRRVYNPVPPRAIVRSYIPAKPRIGLSGPLPPIGSKGPAAVPENPMTLDGLMTGPPGVAIIRWGDTQYVVQKGQKLPNGAVITAIQSTGVTVKNGKQVVRLELGK